MKKLFNNSFENWIFDLDNTIYDIKAGLFVKISERITQYIMEVLSFTKEEANLVRSDMYKKYGLTLTGLMKEYEIDPDNINWLMKREKSKYVVANLLLEIYDKKYIVLC